MPVLRQRFDTCDHDNIAASDEFERVPTNSDEGSLRGLTGGSRTRKRDIFEATQTSLVALNLKKGAFLVENGNIIQQLCVGEVGGSFINDNGPHNIILHSARDGCLFKLVWYAHLFRVKLIVDYCSKLIVYFLLWTSLLVLSSFKSCRFVVQELASGTVGTVEVPVESLTLFCLVILVEVGLLL